ncbi:MAG: ArsR family transcriptional regulator [Candidatus Nitrosopumilus sp. bin_7KS]
MGASNEKVNTQRSAECEKDDIQIFPTDDDRLKLLGEIFSNESSRKILTLLLEKELTVMGISKDSGFSSNLIIHHLKKMVDTDVVTITKESTNSRGRPLKFYRAKPAIVILSKDAANRASSSKSLKKTLGKITRFTAIGLTGVVAWILAYSPQDPLESAAKYPRPILPHYMTPIEPQVQSGEFVFAILITASVMFAGFLITRMIKRFRK